MSALVDERHDAQALVATVLAACGGGRVLVSGRRAAAIAHELCLLGVDASTCTLDVLPGGPPLDLLWIDGPLDDWSADTSDVLARRLRAVGPRALLLRVPGDRDAWVRLFLRHDWRRHPLYQCVTDYAGLEHASLSSLVLLEPMPTDAVLARDAAELAVTRDLHMDMLREPGRRADAHVARYGWARRFVREGDRVLDAACGLGYGSALLADATLAASVVGMDADAWAIAYASQHYGAARGRLSFETRDLASLDELPPASFDVIVSFETLEHLVDPEGFVTACRRLLTPAGRFVCSIPNQWVDASGVDPNPHHLHVFDRARLEALCRRSFLVEHVYGQTAGGGMKLPDRPRAIWPADDASPDAEWWLLAAMRDPLSPGVGPSPERWTPAPAANRSNLLSFERDYDHPWLVPAMVAIGQRTDSPTVLRQLSSRARHEARPGSADEGAALCVQAYRALEENCATEELLAAIDTYCLRESTNVHVQRWRISLRYVQGLLHLARGARGRAGRAFEQCAVADPFAFSPLLVTKTVAAAAKLGWMAAQAGDRERARRWWRHGVDVAERALQRPWSELMVDRDEPVFFGLREATEIIDLASQCATGLHLLPHAADRPGLLASQLMVSHTRPPIERPVRAAAMAPPAHLDHVRRVVIFGTGAAARSALTLADRCDWVVAYLVDNNPAMWNGEAHGHAVRSPEALTAGDYDLVVVASLAGKPAISRQLEALGLVHRESFVHFLDPVALDGVTMQVTRP